MTEPIIVPGAHERADDRPPIAATGRSFDVREWSGSGPDYLHVHYADDEAWHVLEGTLTFRFADRLVKARPGATWYPVTSTRAARPNEAKKPPGRPKKS